MQTSLKSCLWGTIQVPSTEGAWHQAQASIKKGGFGIGDPVLHNPAAFLTSSSGTSFPCSSLWSEFKETDDPDVTAAETQFRLSVQEDSASRPGEGGSGPWCP